MISLLTEMGKNLKDSLAKHAKKAKEFKKYCRTMFSLLGVLREKFFVPAIPGNHSPCNLLIKTSI